LTEKDVEAINKLTAIIEHGKTITKAQEKIIELTEVASDVILDIHRQAKPIRLRQSFAESFVKLFGLEIPTGRAIQYIGSTPVTPVAELERVMSELASNAPLAIKLVDVEIVNIFPYWFEREAQRLSQLLAEKFEVEAVYLFGSLVWSDVHAPETDIDLAISGLPGERYLEAVSFLERESKFPIDLVELSKVSDHLRQRILTEGKLLYEREPVAAFG
jgi:predicted nucleotidyltransferase